MPILKTNSLSRKSNFLQLKSNLRQLRLKRRNFSLKKNSCSNSSSKCRAKSSKSKRPHSTSNLQRLKPQSSRSEGLRCMVGILSLILNGRKWKIYEIWLKTCPKRLLTSGTRHVLVIKTTLEPSKWSCPMEWHPQSSREATKTTKTCSHCQSQTTLSSRESMEPNKIVIQSAAWSSAKKMALNLPKSKRRLVELTTQISRLKIQKKLSGFTVMNVAIGLLNSVFWSGRHLNFD